MRLKVTFLLVLVLPILFLPYHVTAVGESNVRYLVDSTLRRIPNQTISLIQKLDTLDSLDTILSPIKKDANIIPSINCPKPISNPKKDFTSIFTNSKSDINLKNINYESGFDADYIPNDLVDISTFIKTPGKTTICLSYPAATQLIAMKNVMAKEGLSLSVNSGFRSYYEQQKLFVNYAPIAKKVQYPLVAPPGKSEHQSGLAVDVASELNPGRFATSSESDWINNNAHLYGFLVSYPEHDEDKTGYMYEPWHLRYVGIENAVLLHEANYTLAFKPAYYQKSSLDKLLFSLKSKFGSSSVPIPEIGG